MPQLPRLCFIHVPKCGGRSVRKALRTVYPEEEIFGDKGELVPHWAQWPRWRCIVEHLQYRHVMLARGFLMVTILRDPVECEESLLNFMANLRQKGELETHYRFELQVAEADLDRYIVECARDGKMIDYFLPEGSNTIDRALWVVDNLDLVGFISEFDEFMRRLSCLVGVDLPTFHENVSEHRLKFNDQQREALRKKLAMDCMFYERVRHKQLSETWTI